MGEAGRIDRAERPWRFLLAFLCILLVVVLGTVQVAHTHADGNESHADCALCSAAHITVHPVFAPAPAPTTSVVATVEAVPTTTLPRILSTFALFTRPPPVAVVPA
jgi:hypothetical protein